jgi:hypothetical protein
LIQWLEVGQVDQSTTNGQANPIHALSDVSARQVAWLALDINDNTPILPSCWPPFLALPRRVDCCLRRRPAGRSLPALSR